MKTTINGIGRVAVVTGTSLAKTRTCEGCLEGDCMKTPLDGEH